MTVVMFILQKEREREREGERLGMHQQMFRQRSPLLSVIRCGCSDQLGFGVIVHLLSLDGDISLCSQHSQT